MQSENSSVVIPRSWGIASLTSYQAETWDELTHGRSGLLVLPTGGGKSLVFQLWAHHYEGLVVVLTPLIALIEDQAKRARALGIRAKGLHSGMSSDSKQEVLGALAQKKVQLLFVTPERFKREAFLLALKHSQPVTLLVVDEAHLISQWGHDFRPDYRKIDRITQLVTPKQILALTATATPEVVADICSHLSIQSGFKIVAPIARLNIGLHVDEIFSLESKAEAVLREITQVSGPVLIYSSLIKTLYSLEKMIRSKLQRQYWMYHGELSPAERKQNQKQFLASENGVMLATPAFGLGIDKKDLRLVIHLELPGSIEAYFQEVGRAGRDGNPAKAVLLYDEDDILIQMDFIKWSNPDLAYRSQTLQFLFQNKDRLNNFDIEQLKKQLHFYNSRDYRLETTLSHLEAVGYLNKAPQSALGYAWNEELESLDLSSLKENYLDLTQNQQNKLLQLVQFIKNSEQCRMQAISRYFGDTQAIQCGLCDACLG